MRPIAPIAALLVATLFVAGAARAEDPPESTRPESAAGAQTGVEAKADDTPAAENQGPKVISGMSVLGNQEAPKSLVIVPWKSSEIGASLGISAMLDEGRQPVDREVFLRSLTYYEIRSEAAPATGDVPAGGVEDSSNRNVGSRR